MRAFLADGPDLSDYVAHMLAYHCASCPECRDRWPRYYETKDRALGKLIWRHVQEDLDYKNRKTV